MDFEIREGGYYVTNSGLKAGPARSRTSIDAYTWLLCVANYETPFRYNSSGECAGGMSKHLHLAREWTEQDELALVSAAAQEHREAEGRGFGDPVLEGSVSYLEAIALTRERKNTHGDWKTQALCANELKKTARCGPSWENMASWQQEAIDMILTKVSRICCGDPNEPDHYDDIAGYAHLGKGGHSK